MLDPETPIFSARLGGGKGQKGVRLLQYKFRYQFFIGEELRIDIANVRTDDFCIWHKDHFFRLRFKGLFTFDYTRIAAS